MKSNKNATTNNAAQARLEKIKQEVFAALSTAYGEEKARRYFKKVKPRLDNNVFPIIFPHPFSEGTVPDVDLLVTLGRLNLIKLRSIQRKQIDVLNAQIKRLERALAGVPQESNDIPLDNRHCLHSAVLYGERMQSICDMCPIQHEFRNQLAAATLKDFFGTAISLPTCEGLPTDEVCLLFDSSADAEPRRAQLIAAVNTEIANLRQEKRRRIDYIDNLNRALNDERTLPDLPLFADLRDKDYLVDKIVCFFADETYPMLLNKNRSTLYLCRITDFTASEETENKLANRQNYKSVELYLNANFSFEEFLEGKATIEDASFTTHPIIVQIDQRQPYVMRFDDLLELKRHPQYAKMWVYSSFRPWYVQPTGAEPLLTTINKLAPNERLGLI